MTARNYVCPHCGTASFAFDDVRSLGPALSVTCRSCQRRASVSLQSTLLFLAAAFGPSLVLGLFLMATLGSASASDLKFLVALPLITAFLLFPKAMRLYYSKLRLAKR